MAKVKKTSATGKKKPTKSSVKIPIAIGTKKPTAKPAKKKASSKSGAKSITKKTAKKVTSTGSATKKAASKKAAKKAKRKPETLMCFLTTACVDYYSLPDNGYELTTLRHYRDTYLASSAEGKKLIKQYYEVAPKIVELANQDKERRSVYAFIYSEIRSACSKIEDRNFLEAKNVYTDLVKALMKRYRLN